MALRYSRYRSALAGSAARKSLKWASSTCTGARAGQHKAATGVGGGTPLRRRQGAQRGGREACKGGQRGSRTSAQPSATEVGPEASSHLCDGVPAEPGGAGGHQVSLLPLLLLLAVGRARRALLLRRHLHRRVRHQHALRALALQCSGARQSNSPGWSEQRPGTPAAVQRHTLTSDAASTAVQSQSGRAPHPHPACPHPKVVRMYAPTHPPTTPKAQHQEPAPGAAVHDRASKQRLACEMSTALATSMALRLGCTTFCWTTPSATTRPAPAWISGRGPAWRAALGCRGGGQSRKRRDGGGQRARKREARGHFRRMPSLARRLRQHGVGNRRPGKEQAALKQRNPRHC